MKSTLLWLFIYIYIYIYPIGCNSYYIIEYNINIVYYNNTLVFGLYISYLSYLVIYYLFINLHILYAIDYFNVYLI